MNFKQFSTSDNQWHDIPYYTHKTATDTLTLPAVIYPNDTSITVGLKGNEEHTGTPSPQNPVMPNGTGERTGNLVNVASSNCIVYSNYNQFIIDNSSIDITGNALFGFIVKCNSNAEYTVSCIRTGYNVDMRIREYSDLPTDWTNDFITQSVNQSTAAGNSATFTTTATTKYLLVCFYGSSIARISNIMLNLGSTALPYEPYGIKIPILSGGTTTPVYLGEVQSTRRIKKLVLTGEENWEYEGVYSRFLINVADFTTFGLRLTPFISNVFGSISDGRPLADVPDNSIYSGTPNGDDIHKIYIKCTTYTSLNDWLSYLATQYAAGTPVTVWYVLAEPTTGIVNEPLMKIDTYADSLTTSIPCTAGENTLDVQTTVAPSEVTAEFSGWHPVQNVHEYDSNYTIATMQSLTITQLQTHTISDLQGGEWS